MAKQNSKGLVSLSLFKQSLKANWLLWVILTVGSALIFVVINLVIFSKKIFTNIDMSVVSVYVADEDMSWLKVLGLLEQMGFPLGRIQTMSKIDLNSVLNELTYKIAGVFLPMVYVMITANQLICSQVSDGSMAYILSTPTNRKKVVFTQFLYLMLSIIAMYVVITLSALGSQFLAQKIAQIKGNQIGDPLYLRSLLYCFASFCSIICLGGLCFGASAFFNKVNYSISFGGAVCIISFLCCILGLFGNKVFVSVGVGVSAMNVFNYGSVFTLIDTDSISDFAKALANYDVTISYDWIWKCGILLFVGLFASLFGGIRFTKKDLPL